MCGSRGAVGECKCDAWAPLSSFKYVVSENWEEAGSRDVVGVGEGGVRNARREGSLICC